MFTYFQNTGMQIFVRYSENVYLFVFKNALIESIYIGDNISANRFNFSGEIVKPEISLFRSYRCFPAR
jgi:hypothetical protein